jgi:hypothetical protein
MRCDRRNRQRKAAIHARLGNSPPTRAQWAVQNAAGGRALKGFTNDVARRRAWHTFEMRRRYRSVFENYIEALVTSGRVEVEINGRRLGGAVRRQQV